MAVLFEKYSRKENLNKRKHLKLNYNINDYSSLNNRALRFKNIIQKMLTA